MSKVDFVVTGQSGGHGIFERSFPTFREALSCFLENGYCDHVHSGQVSMRIKTNHNTFYGVICLLPSEKQVLSRIFVDSFAEDGDNNG